MRERSGMSKRVNRVDAREQADYFFGLRRLALGT